MARDKAAKDTDLTPADEEIVRLYESVSPPVDWDASDDAILEFSRNVSAKTAAGAEGADSEPAAGHDPDAGTNANDTVVPFRRPGRSFVGRIIQSPATGFALAASLAIGMVMGQGISPYLDFGVAPKYGQVVRDNARLKEELRHSQQMVTRSLGGPAGQRPGMQKGTVDLTDVTRLLGGYDCSHLTATLSKDRRMEISGFVSRSADLDSLAGRLASIQRSIPVTNFVKVYEEPFCGAIAVLQEFGGAAGEVRQLPTVRPYRHGPQYMENERLVVEAEATTLYDGYLYVDFIQHNGNVLHLFPAPHLPNNAVKAGQTVLLGRDGPNYTVAAPFGDEMLMVVSSPKPLFEKARPQVERAQSYFADLESALRNVGGKDHRGVAVSNYDFIKTKVSANDRKPGR